MPWISADKFLKDLEAADDWTPELDAIEALMSDDGRGGGLFGIDPAMHRVRDGLIRLGSDNTPR